MAREIVCPACGASAGSWDGESLAVLCSNCSKWLDVRREPPAVLEAAEHDMQGLVDALIATSPEGFTPSKRTRVLTRSQRQALVTVVAVACGMAAGYWAAHRPSWRTHESVAGGFKIDLPAAPEADAARKIGLPPESGHSAEGTAHGGLQYVVVWGEITDREGRTDDQFLAGHFGEVAKDKKMARLLRSDPFTVGGLRAYDLQLDMPNGEYALVRVLVANTRLYLLNITAKSNIDPHSPEVRRFFSSFRVTDPKLMTETPTP